MAKVSVLVPVYNVERYIECCLRSLFEQTLDDIEYVIVDDCSPDGSMAILTRILEDYPHRKDQVKKIRRSQNGGLAAARKTAVETATGDYTIHIDSDDWVEPTMCERLYAKAMRDDADIVVCDYFAEFPDRRVCCKQSTPKDAVGFTRALMREDVSWSMWNKLIRLSLYDNVEIAPGLNMGEDMLTTIRLSCFANKVSYLPEAFLHYRQDNPNSLIKTFSAKSVDDLLGGVAELERFFADKPCYSDDLKWLQLRTRATLLMHTAGERRRQIAAMWPDVPRRRTLVRPRNIRFPYRVAHWFAVSGWMWAANVIYGAAEMVKNAIRG